MTQLGTAWFGVSGLLIGQAVGGVIFGLLSAVLAWRVMNKVESGAADVSKQALFAREIRRMQHGFWKR